MMRCKKRERWLSDFLDGELSGRKAAILMHHLESCPSCRDYRKQIEEIDARMKDLERSEFYPAQAFDHVARVKLGLETVVQGSEKGEKPGLSKKWIWVPASLASLFILSLLFFLYLSSSSGETLYAMSFEDAMEQVSFEIRGDPEMEKVFDFLIEDSIDELLEDFFLENGFHYEDFSLFLEMISDEELLLLQSDKKVKADM